MAHSRTGLPAQPTRLIGREAEVVAARQRLLCPDVRLLTLTGPAGTGKTRLALQVATELREAFVDGVVFVDLAPVSDPTLVVSAIARALGIREAPGQALLEGVKRSLRHKRALLVLDNFEQVVAAAPRVAELLGTCPELKGLATSREPLHLHWEHQLPVSPLGLPDLHDLPHLDELATYPAVALFVERAQTVNPDYRLDHETARSVAEICVRLDGLPLAIELAAARGKMLLPQTLLARLRRPLDLLTDGARDDAARHQTLRSAIGWSYELLPAEEQALLRRLAVFVGGWRLEAAEAVCGSVLDLLTRLVEKSLVQTEQQGGEMRYRLLEVVRQYADEKLRVSGEASVLRARHCAWYLGLAEAAELRLRRAEDDRWLTRLEVEHDNLRAALSWSETALGSAAPEGPFSTDAPVRQAGPRLAGALWWFWHLRGYANEGLRQLEKVLATPRMSAAVRAKVLNGIGFLLYDRGEYGRALSLLEESLALSRQVRDTFGTAFALASLGFVAQFRGDYARATALLEEGLSLARRSGDTFNVARALNNLGVVAIAVGESGRAEALLEESLTLWRELRSKSNVALGLFLLGRAAHDRGDYERARALLEESLSLAREAGYPRATGFSLQCLGMVAQARGEPERAAAYFRDSLGVRLALGDRRSTAMCLEGLAGVAAAQARPARAARLLGAAEALREAIGAPTPPAGRAAHEREVAALRAALDGEAFAAAWADGRALPLERAVDYAMRVEAPAAQRPGERPEPRLGPLTPRQQEVAALIARGLTSRQIADELVLTESTAETHVKHILHKLGFASRAQIAAWVVEQRSRAAPPKPAS